MSIYNFHIHPSRKVQRLVLSLFALTLGSVWYLPYPWWLAAILTLVIMAYGGLTLQQLKRGYLHLRFSNEYGWQLIQSDQSTRAVDIHYSTLVARRFIGFSAKPHGGKIIRQWLCKDSFCDTQQLGHFIRLLRY